MKAYCIKCKHFSKMIQIKISICKNNLNIAIGYCNIHKNNKISTILLPLKLINKKKEINVLSIKLYNF